MNELSNETLTIRSVEDIDKLRKWLSGRSWDHIQQISAFDTDTAIQTETFLLTRGSNKVGTVVVHDVAAIHKNALRIIGLELQRTT